MRLLDSLVSDLIRSSTGFNARPFVRAVGGKNILLLGGAAIAGALAADKMRGQGAGEGQVAPPPPPLPPPIPGTGAAVAPPPPPIPQQAPEAALPQDVLFAIVRTLVAGALADGEMHEKEKKLIESRLGEGDLSSEQTDRIRKDLVFPASVEEIASLVKGDEDRELLFRFGALVVLADGAASPAEKTWIESFGRALGLSADRQSSLQSEIFETT